MGEKAAAVEEAPRAQTGGASLDLAGEAGVAVERGGASPCPDDWVREDKREAESLAILSCIASVATLLLRKVFH